MRLLLLLLLTVASVAFSEFCTRDSCADASPEAAECLKWARQEEEKEEVPDWLDRIREVAPCPADAEAARRAVKENEWRDDLCCSGSSSLLPVAMATEWLCGGPRCHFHVGAEFCVRSRAVELPDGSKAGQQCCYSGGHLLTNPAEGAGSADRIAGSFASFLGHWRRDVVPFKNCCGEGIETHLCSRYLTRRPPNVR